MSKSNSSPKFTPVVVDVVGIAGEVFLHLSRKMTEPLDGKVLHDVDVLVPARLTAYSIAPGVENTAFGQKRVYALLVGGVTVEISHSFDDVAKVRAEILSRVENFEG